MSIGQRRKLEIARLMAEGPNVLLLDEPTNYISLDVLEAFEAAILGFPGPVIAVSHWFMQRFRGWCGSWWMGDWCGGEKVLVTVPSNLDMFMLIEQIHKEALYAVVVLSSAAELPAARLFQEQRIRRRKHHTLPLEYARLR